VPAEYRLQDIKTNDFRPIPIPSDLPFKVREGARAVALDTEAPSASAKFIVKTVRGGELRAFTFTVSMDFVLPFTLVKYSCAESGISLLKRTGNLHFVYLVANCEDNGDAIDLYILTSPDAVIANTTLPDTQGEGKGWIKYTIPKPKVIPSRGVSLGELDVGDPSGQKSMKYEVIAVPPRTPPRFYMTLTLGVSHLLYQEDPRNIRLTELAGVAKINMIYALIPRSLDIGGNAFMTVAPFSHTPLDLPAAKFYGINGRVGYRLPVGLGATEWSFLVGGYWWGMLVPGNTFGIKALSGPQVFITTRTQQYRHRSFFLYFKFAPISDSLSTMSLSNREIAGGGGYQLTSPEARRDVTLTLDVAEARFHSDLEGNSMRLISYSLGLQTGL
jgi:hypothetical protein